jgi:hypothetical protein
VTASSNYALTPTVLGITALAKSSKRRVVRPAGPVSNVAVSHQRSPEAHRRLSPGLRGGILQSPWPDQALQRTPRIAVALPSGAADVFSLAHAERYDGTLGQAKHRRDRPENVKRMELLR